MEKGYLLNVIILWVLLSQCDAQIIKTGVNAVNFTLEDISGKKITLQELQGNEKEKNIVAFSFVNVHAKACWREIGTLQTLYRKYRDQGIVVRLISIDTCKPEKIKEYIDKYRIEIPILLDPDGARAGKIYGAIQNNKYNVPRLIVIGKDNKVKLAITRCNDKILRELQGKLELWLAEELYPVEENSNTITIVYTGNTDGYLESCDCAWNPFGGLVRRATYINELRKRKKNILIVDTGDIFPEYPHKIQVKYCIQAMKLMQYDAVMLGEQEFILGCDFIIQEIEKNSLPFISSNLSICTEDRCIPLSKHYIIKRIGNYRIGILGVISESAFTFFPKDNISKLKIHDVNKTLKRFINILREKEKVDLIVVLSHLGYETDKLVAEKVSDIDIIIGGHSHVLLRKPVKINNTIILQPGEKGQYVGVFTINMNTGAMTNRMLPLTKDTKDDKRIRQLINKYTKELKNAAKILEF
jgi:peroxiredoxin